MNRNTEQRFANVPSLEISRSKFNRSFTHKTTFNAADIIPIYCDMTIMPGDTVKMGMSEVVRMMTPICPVMDNAYLDTYFFFVPYRLIWDHFREFMGENTSAPWIQQTQYTAPQVVAPYQDDRGANGYTKGSLADYFGIPTGKKNFKFSVLPFRAYAAVWNEFFRDENLQYPMDIEKNVDADTIGCDIAASSVGNLGVKYAVRGAGPLKACKYHDYFTSCLPAAQKGPAVTIPLSTEMAPVLYGKRIYQDSSSGTLTYKQATTDDYVAGKAAYTNYNGNIADESKTDFIAASKDQTWPTTSNPFGTTFGPTTGIDAYPLLVDLSNATGATINQLRQAFAIQKFYERQARGGTRYIEMIKSHFNVTNPDYRLQRPEYLGGKRIPVNMNQVVQNAPYVEYSDDQSEVVGTTPMGATGAYSVTSDTNHDLFTHSFTEHGILLGLAVIRTDHTYQQGLNRQYSMKNMLDWYFPEFANLGEQAVLNKEIYLQGNNTAADEEAFGYQEAWAHYRYTPDIVTGEMRSNYSQSLDIWHYADYYESKPTLSDDWIKETDANIERTLAVQTHDQFLGDFYFDAIYTRPMPLYSVPGLIDHH